MKKLLSLLVVCCILITGCQKSEESSSFDKYMEEGKTAVASEQYEKALKFFSLAKEEKADDIEANALYNQSNNLVEVIKSKNDQKYDVAIQLCDVIEKMSSESSVIKEAAKSLKDECDTLSKKEDEKETASEQTNNNVSNNSINNHTNTDNSTPKYYYLNRLNNIRANYANAYDNLVSTSEIREMASREYSDWDNLLNQIWGTLKEQLPTSVMRNLTTEQKSWIKQKEARAKELSSQPGTISLIESASYLAETTKERCYYLVNNYME